MPSGRHFSRSSRDPCGSITPNKDRWVCTLLPRRWFCTRHNQRRLNLMRHCTNGRLRQPRGKNPYTLHSSCIEPNRRRLPKTQAIKIVSHAPANTDAASTTECNRRGGRGNKQGAVAQLQPKPHNAHLCESSELSVWGTTQGEDDRETAT